LDTQGNADSPSRGHFILISAVVAITLLGDALLYGVLPAHPQDFAVAVWQVGILLSANRFVRIVTNEIAGRLRHTHRNSGRATVQLIIAALVGTAITAGYAVPWGFGWLLLLRLLWGACWSVLRIGGYMTAIETSTSEDRGRNVGIFQAIVRCGQGGGVLAGGLITDLVGLRSAFVLFALVGVGATAVAGVRLGTGAKLGRGARLGEAGSAKLGRNAEPAESRTASDRGPAGTESRRERLKGVLSLWLIILGVAMSTEMLANLTGAIVADRIAGELPVALGAATLTGFFLGVRSFSTMVMGPLFGYISDQKGRYRTVQAASLLQIVVAAVAVASAGWITPALALLVYLVLGSGLRTAAMAVAADHAANSAGSVEMGRISTVSDIAAAASPVVAFTVYGWAGLVPVGAILSVLLLAALLGAHVRRGGSGEQAANTRTPR